MKLKIEQMRVDELAPYAGNAKEHPAWQVEQIANSIDQFGFNDPVGVWTNPQGVCEIVEGHGRVLAAKLLGLDSVPVIRLDHLDDDARRAYVHVHNQTTLTSGFDLDRLQAEMDSIAGFEWADFGFDMPWMDKEPEVDLDEIVEVDVPEVTPTRCERGQVWKCGEHRVMCGDSTSATDMDRLMGEAQAQLLLTDPPYNVAYNQNDSASCDPVKAHQRPDKMTIMNDKFRDESAFCDFLTDAFTACKMAMAPGASLYVWFASMHAPAVFEAVEDAGLEPKQVLQWVKSQFTLGRQDYQWAHEPCIYGRKGGAGHYFTESRKESTVIDDAMDTKKMTKTQLREALENILQSGVETTVLRYAKPVSSDLHPTTKPVKLFARLMRNSSRKGDAVLDAFGGSGTTLMAAEQLRRRAYLMELDPHYCDVILERWERFTGEKAELLG